MRPCIYLLKANPPSGDNTVAFAHAERVRQDGGWLWPENVQAPDFVWQGGVCRAVGRRLPERRFQGHAHRVPAPEWFRREAAPAAAELSRRDWERRLAITPLGDFCRHPEIRLALAQDRLAAEIGPLLGLPDLISGEDRLGRDWENERPVAAAEARASIEALERINAALPPQVLRLRLSLRRSALRRLDVAAVGREIFSPCPAFFGEPYLPRDLAGGPVLKAGIVRLAQAWPDPESETRSRAWRSDPALVQAVEQALFPLLPPPGPEAEASFVSWSERWLALAPLRDFESRSPLPLFPFRSILPGSRLPESFRRRIRPETPASLGGSDLTLVAAGLSPYIAEPFQTYCAARSEQLAAWAEDPVGLAAYFWGSQPKA